MNKPVIVAEEALAEPVVVDDVPPAAMVRAAAAGPAYVVLAGISFSHFLNDTMQSLIASIYPILKDAYALAGPQIKQGQSLKSWNTGNIAVIPYPVDAIKYAPMKIDFSYPNEAQVEIALLPKVGAAAKPQLFLMDLVRRKGKWLVNSWVPRSSPPVPNGSDNNGAGN